MKNFTLFVLLAFLSSVCILNAQNHSKIDALLYEQAIERGAVEVIIIFKEQADVSYAKNIRQKEQKGQYVFQTLQQTAQRTQAKALAVLEKHNAAHHTFLIVNAIYAKAKMNVLEEIAQLPEVSRIQIDPIGVIDEARPSTLGQGRDLVEWGIEKIGADQVWNMGITGEGVIVGGQDTGVEWDHDAIKDQYRGWDGATADHNYNWHDAISEISPLHGDTTDDESLNPCGLDIDAPCDDHNHGTHTVGTMVGDDGNGNQIGVAPGAKWIAARNMERGWGKLSTYTDCFEWFLAPTDVNNENPDPSKAPHVINNSWGCPPVEGCEIDNWSIMETAINNLRAAGVVVVVSAGNNGASCGRVQNPAAIFEGSFSIGASNDVDTLGGFSSAGPVTVDGSNRLKPNVVAPGVQVRSCIRNGGYATWNGTSMAGPHVAGVVALMISANPELAGQVELIEDILEQTAVPLFAEDDCGDFAGSAHPNTFYGFGRIDALAAVTEAMMTTNTEEMLDEAMIDVFPNPVDDLLNIRMNQFGEATSLQILDASGRLVLQENLNDALNTIDLSKLSAGVYFYNLRNNLTNISGKIVKK